MSRSSPTACAPSSRGWNPRHSRKRRTLCRPGERGLAVISAESSDAPVSPRDAATEIVLTLRRAGHEAYFVGGCVRDIVLGVEPGDYDIVTSARPDEVRSLFPRTVPVGEAFGVVLVLEPGEPEEPGEPREPGGPGESGHEGQVPSSGSYRSWRRYEVATYRTEHGYADGRRPTDVAFATAEEDVERRDFTMNGLLMDPETGEIVDHVGGREDIDRRLVRTIGDPAVRFAEDHLRMLRAVRFAANLDFRVDAAALEAIRRNARLISRISAERIREELTKLLVQGRPPGRGGARRGMELLAETGLLAEILPELDAARGVTQPPRFHPEGDVWEHVMVMLDLMPPGPDPRRHVRASDVPTWLPRLAWGVVMHDIGKAVTRTEDESGVHFYHHAGSGVEIAGRVMRRLRFPTADVEAVKELVHHHMRFMHVTEMRPNTLKRLLRMPDFDLHLELHRLDCASSHGKLGNYDFCVRKLEEFGEEELQPPRILTGKDLMAMGFAPGPLFGEMLKAVEDAQLDGKVATTEEAKALVMERWADKRGP